MDLVIIVGALIALGILEWKYKPIRTWYLVDEFSSGTATDRDRIDVLLNKYITVAREARAPLLPAVQEIKNSLPQLAFDYHKLERLEEKTHSELKKAAYKMEREEIEKGVRETITFVKAKLHELEILYAQNLYDDICLHTDTMSGNNRFTASVERARDEARGLLEAEGPIQKN